MKKINEIIQDHPFFKGFTTEELNFISGCGQNKVFKKDEVLAREGEPADEFFLIREGKIGVCISTPHQGIKAIQTLGEGEIFGWSWIFPPYKWVFDGIALETTHVVALNGKCLREKLEQTPVLGYKLMKRFSQNMISRLNAARLQLLDIYGNPK